MEDFIVNSQLFFSLTINEFMILINLMLLFD